VVKGKKSENEKFAGALYTTSVEAFVPGVGRGVQGATSHFLAQNFAKMFGIEFENEEGKRQHVWQNSWGLTTRTIGVMVMVHSDDKGLVLPPRVAPVQVVVIPIVFKEHSGDLKDKSRELAGLLTAAGIRTEVDAREHHNPGWKYADWELKGVPVRLELGPKDLAAKKVVAVSRTTGTRTNIEWKDLVPSVTKLLDGIQAGLFEKATADMKSHTKQVTKWDDFMNALDGRNIALVPWCGVTACEKAIKVKSGEWADVKDAERAKTAPATATATATAAAAAAEGGEQGEQGEKVEKLTGAAKSLCIPFQQPALPANTICIGCATVATTWALFGRSY